MSTVNASDQVVPRRPARRLLHGLVAGVALLFLSVPAGQLHGQERALATLPLIQKPHLIYAGAFRVPGGNFGSSSFDYGGTAIAFNPVRDSLYMVGHDHQQHVAEISIPALRISRVVGALSTATVLQPFADVTEGTLGKIGPGNAKVGGLLPYRGLLFVTGFLFYDGNGEQKPSHFVSGTDLRVKNDVRGPFRVGQVGAGFVSGFFGLVPTPWQTALGGPVLNGQCCLNVISRTSYGPAVFAIDPATIGTTEVAPAAALVYYTARHPLLETGAKGDGWSNTSKLFNGTTLITGVVFPENTASVLFFGRQGVGKFCYGEADICGDTSDTAKGNHAPPYHSYVWAYNANDLAAVRAGKKEPWAVRPYATWEVELPFANGSGLLRGAAYDAKTGRIFLSQAYGDREFPVVHVLNVAVPR